MTIPPTTKRMRVTVDGKTYEVSVEMLSEGTEVEPLHHVPVASHPAPAPAASPAPVSAPPRAAPPAPAGAGSISSPLAGTVVTVHVKEGQQVNAGDLLVTLEAMKMNTPIRAPSAGTVRSIHVSAGQSVEEGASLLVVS